MISHDDPRCVRLLAIASALPEVAAQGERHITFRVGKKSFAWFLNDHHDDGRLGIAVKVPRGENAALAAVDPERYYLPAYLGADGWVGIRIDGLDIDWEEIADRMRDAYLMQAPKRLGVFVGSG